MGAHQNGDRNPTKEGSGKRLSKRKLAWGLGIYLILGLVGSWGITDARIRQILWIFLAALAIKSWIAWKRG